MVCYSCYCVIFLDLCEKDVVIFTILFCSGRPRGVRVGRKKGEEDGREKVDVEGIGEARKEEEGSAIGENEGAEIGAGGMGDF